MMTLSFRPRWMAGMGLVCVSMLLLASTPPPASAQAPSSAVPDRHRNQKPEDLCGGCSVFLGEGVWGVANQSSACEPDCLTSRIVMGGHSDFMPVRRPGAGSDRDAGPPGGAPAGSGGTDGAPAPPTLAEALGVCPSPEPPVVGVNPDREGVTGLETYLWAEPQAGQSGAGEVRGHPVGCTLTPVSWTWETGDGAIYTRERGGGPHPDNPAGHVYQTKGHYTITLTVRWRADTTVGTAVTDRSSQRPYQVVEIRSVLTG